MQTVILAIQIMCAGVLVAGLGLSMFQLWNKSAKSAVRRLQRFSYAAANDFETDFRRLARASR